MFVDSAGNIYLTSASDGLVTNDDIVTLKYDPDGQMVWQAVYNGSDSQPDRPYGMAVDESGYVYVTGRSNTNNNSFDMVTIKYDADGNELWVNQYDGSGSGDIGHSIATDRYGNAYVAGKTTSDETGSDFIVIKYHSDGLMDWIQRQYYIRDGSDEATDIAVDNEGYVYATGRAGYSEPCGYFYLTMKYDNDGNVQWASRYSSGIESHECYARAIAVDGEGNTIVTGVCTGMISYGWDMVTVKYSPTGQELWVARYDGPINATDNVEEVLVDVNGYIYIVGSSYGEGTGLDIITIKYAPDGTEEWIARYDGPVGGEEDEGKDIAIDIEGNVYVTGFSDWLDFGYNSNYTTIMYNSEGVEQWVMSYETFAEDNDHANAIGVDATGDVIVTGWSDWSGTGSYQWDITTIKYSEPLVSPHNDPTQTPTNYELHPAYPNPFNPSTNITYFLPEAADVTLSIFDVHGRLVDQLVNGHRKSGRHDVTFDASGIPSGIYFYRLSTHDFERTDKMVLMK
jgi:uncharacterized delta-60 repeat protein